MAQVIGVGGIFFKFKDPKAMLKWYEEVLGMKTNPYGVLFEFNGDTDPKKGFLQLGTFESTSDYFGDEKQQSMINFRVDDLAKFKAQLESSGVKILDDIESYSYGKFLHIEDPEGNRIELWEPIDQEFDNGESMPMR